MRCLPIEAAAEADISVGLGAPTNSAAIQEYRTDPPRHADLGDYKPVLADIDPYRDGHATLRMGRYLAWLLDALGAGMSRQHAMESVNRLFRDRSGEWRFQEASLA